MTSIGGQAIIEGIMMRGPEKIAIAVRKPDGEITIKEEPTKIKGGIRKIPFVRGIFSFVDSMVIGIKALMFSANFYEDDGTPKEEEKESVSEQKKESASESKKESNEMPMWVMALTVMTSLALSVGLFIALPNVIAGFLVPSGGADTGSHVVLYNVVESVVKIVLFLGYLFLVSRMKDIQRVFEYHGAEHKSIFCYEHGEELTVEHVKKYQRFHPRCGTSFLLFVVIISIVVFSVVGRFESKLVNVLVRIALLPVVAGISYEIIRFAGKHTEDKWISWLNQPGMWLQRLTTREPDDKQIEVAIEALKKVIPEDQTADQW